MPLVVNTDTLLASLLLEQEGLELLKRPVAMRQSVLLLCWHLGVSATYSAGVSEEQATKSHQETRHARTSGDSRQARVFSLEDRVPTEIAGPSSWYDPTLSFAFEQ